jgi:exodeoxyribonuclease VII large subunit
VTQLRERGRRLDREIAQRLARETERLAAKKQRMVQLLPALVRHRVERLARAAAELGRLSPLAQVARREEALRERGRSLSRTASARLTRARNALSARRPAERLDRALTERFAIATRGLEHRRQRLVALSPDGVLSRGYSITQDAESGAVLRTSEGTAINRRVRIRLGAGKLGAVVDEVES